jgi:uncharacterized membrane protein YfcA
MFALIFLCAAAGGAVAAISGFGIGSMLTPVLAAQIGVKTAVAAVSVPHLCGTAIRFWRMREDVDVDVLRRFGIPSAAGGLAGALLNAWASSPTLALIFGALLFLAGTLQISGKGERWRLRGRMAWVAGAASGFFGGLVGNQGGIRSAAMLGFDVSKVRFVATSTAVALLVDIVRVPVYLYVAWNQIVAISGWVIVAIAGVVSGTLAGAKLLAWIPERRFRQLVGTTLLLLGLSMVLQARSS